MIDLRNVIFYFTGTGNSLKIARDLAAGIGETELVSIPKAMREPADRWMDAERIGFVFPVYFEGTPLIVDEFVDRLTLRPDVYLFAVCNCGGAFGTTLASLDKRFKAKGAHLSLGDVLKMPGNYLPLYDRYPEDLQKRLFDEEPQRVKLIVEAVKARTGRVVRDNPIVNVLFSGIFHPIFAKKARDWDRSFIADERCTHCGTCCRVCPVGNIELKDGKPVWNHRCEQCFACIQWCPAEAIQCNKKSSQRRRYHHPEITLNDIIGSANKEA